MFNFEQHLSIAADEIVFTDALRQEHTFTGSGSSWSAPNGFLATLVPDDSGWKLSFFDGQSLVFDGSGKLITLKDDRNNTTAYTWTDGRVTQITAANGQSITLTYSGSKLASASYQTTAGTRTVSYATASPWEVTYFPGTGRESRLTYGYASNRLTALTQNDWPSAGQSAGETFVYASGKLAELRFADLPRDVEADARPRVDYGTDQATIPPLWDGGGRRWPAHEPRGAHLARVRPPGALPAHRPHGGQWRERPDRDLQLRVRPPAGAAGKAPRAA